MTEIVITPSHGERDTASFRRSVRRLKEDGHYQCFVSGKTDKLQVHHIAEFSLEHCVDFDKLKAFLLKFDPYGYSKLLVNNPIISIDDVRNMIVLDQEHHTGVDHEDGGSGIGIHETSFPVWVIQVVAKDGFNPVPQRGETIETVKERID
jgi:hypothetical protein